MSEVEESSVQESVQEHLQEIVALLDKQRLVEDLVHKQEMPRHALVESIVQKRHAAELQRKLDSLHSADVAYILEALPRDQRMVVWDLVKADREGEVLLELSEPVREALIAQMDPADLLAAAETLDTDELADLAPDLPDDVMDDVFKALPVEEREQLRAAMSYPEDSVGALMDFDLVTIRDDVTLEVVLRYLRRLEELPDHTDQIFVVDRGELLKGVLTLHTLLVNDPERLVADLMAKDMLTLVATDKASEAAQAFERYDLVTAPVVDDKGQLAGRVSVDAVMDYIRQAAESERLNLGGLRQEEDIFSSVWASAKNRWTWLASTS
jgi:magnesium transporter